MDETSGRQSLSNPRLLDAALIVMTIGALAMLAMQAIRGDWFPPEVSISQYGVGEYGWTLTMTLLFSAFASALLLIGSHRQAAEVRWSVLVPWGIWILALVVMAFVPTNEWPAPLSLTGKIHQAAAIFALFFAPIGAVAMTGVTRRDRQKSTAARARAVAIACAGLSWFFLGLLMLTNIDIDFTGLGYVRAWALHQTVAVVLDIVVVFALIICLRARESSATGRIAPSEGTTAVSATQSRPRSPTR